MRRSCEIAILALGIGGVILIAGQVSATDTSAAAPSNARISDLLSLAVYGSDNEKLGKVEDLVVDPGAGKIRYAVLSFGGILGIGDKYFALPWKDVTVFYKGTNSSGTQKDVYATIDISKEALKNAPGFDKNHWPNFADPSFAKDIEAFYGSNRAAARIHGDTR